MACPERVGKGVITWQCDLPEGHSGPHRAQENAPSIREHQRWLVAQDHAAEARATLSQFQGPPETTAQRYTENPTAVPGATRAEQIQEADPEPPGSYQAWDLVDGSRITKDAGRFWLSADGRNEPVEIDQRRAIELLDADRRQREAKEPVITAPNPGIRENLKFREGDQVLPTKNDRQDIQSMVMADLEARRQVGISRYGTALQAHNGRDMLRDLYEELMDACVYIRGVIEERDNP